ncbi:hypothetical protein NliqN6_6293 [Naganishia liquefaciens]|uniref:Uncharacterized protein n=1 Tax=Naganishia liquefaciens TaxID=104408 RepID=A0A8H3YJU6_9TREE|nr:hypothetical protein NliqN6_6293 [Naganishia liquefaciens]
MPALSVAADQLMLPEWPQPAPSRGIVVFRSLEDVLVEHLECFAWDNLFLLEKSLQGATDQQLDQLVSIITPAKVGVDGKVQEIATSDILLLAQ